MEGWIELPKHVLCEADWNYKVSDAKLMKKLESSIRKNGLVQNLIVRPIAGGKYEIVNGNHRYKALEFIQMDKVMTYSLGNVSLAKAKRIAVETNETNFGRDDGKLAGILRDIKEEFDAEDLHSTISQEVINIDKVINKEVGAIQEQEKELGSSLVYSDVTTNSSPAKNDDMDWYNPKDVDKDELRTIKHVVPKDVKTLYDTQLERIVGICKKENMDISSTQAVEILIDIVSNLSNSFINQNIS